MNTDLILIAIGVGLLLVAAVTWACLRLSRVPDAPRAAGMKSRRVG